MLEQGICLEGELPDGMPPEGRMRLLAEWNDTTTPFPEKCVHQLFEAVAQESPDAVAVLFRDESLSYGELNTRANQLAHTLMGMGVVPDTPVAIALERSPEMIVALLAVLKAGGAYVPLDPGYPPERLAYMLEDSGSRILITQEKLRHILPEPIQHLLCLDTDRDAVAVQPGENPDRPFTPEQLAYIIYTSGSTGKPKGCLISHRSVVRLVRNTNYLEVAPSDRFLQFAPLSFDAATFEIWGALLNGAGLHVFPPGIPSLEELGEFIGRRGITVLWLTAPLFHLMVDHQLDTLAGVRRLLAGGDVLSASPVRKFLRTLRPGQLLINGYGPTEGTTFSCCHPMDASTVIGDLVPIGRPISNTTVFILDERNRPSLPGVPGELHIGGAGLARGYLNRPELTAERFIPDPFSPVPGARLYRSGDLARHRSDGAIEFLGRMDHQVKIRGFRIELGEIEAALAAHGGVREAVVVARSEGDGEKRLVAYVVLVPELQPTQGELRAFLKRSLPDYMLPGAWVILPDLPLTPNGKIDRKALSELDSCSPTGGGVPPRDTLEEILLNLWSTLLRRTGIGVHDNFFDLGGHSLLATQLTSRLRDSLGMKISVRRIFESPTVAQLADHIRAIREGGVVGYETSGAGFIFPVSRDRELPLSFAQQRLWFLDQLEGPSSTYNIPVVLDISGELDSGALNRALSEIVRRHEVLRSCLVVRGGEPVQVIMPAELLILPVVDLRGSADPAAEADRLSHHEAVTPFNLAEDAPLRGRVLRRGESTWTLLLTLHHGAADGWSVDILFRELSLLYGAFRDGKPSPLPELGIQYADYALWQLGWLTEERRNRQFHYWQSRLTGAPDCLNLPTDRPRPLRQSHRGGVVPFTVDTSLTAGLLELGRREGGTLFMTLLAAWATLLSRYSGEDDLVIGSPVANRTQSSVENLIGFFVNTLALRADLSGNPSFLEFLARTRHTCLEAYAHQDLPFEMLVESLDVPRDLAHAPLFQVMFVLQNMEQEIPLLPATHVTVLERESVTSKFDLTLSMTELQGELAATLEYAADLFDRATIERMSGQFIELLQSIIAAPHESIGRLNLLSPKEKARLLYGCNDNAAPLPEGCVQHLFEARAAETPDATAVIFADEFLTYRDLNRRANQLAHTLIGLGVGPDAPVAISLERSTEMIVTLLAVLKAGGAYLPLDPAFPPGRRAFMLEDSGARILITRDTLRRLLPEATQLLSLDTNRSDISRQPETNPDTPVTPEHLAYIIYTSGSTGRPKGCLITHRSVVRLVRNTNYIDITPRDLFLQYAPLSFDAATFEIWGALLNGAGLVVFHPQMPNPGELGAFIRSRGITILWLTTALFNLMVDRELYSLTGVRRLLTGGDVLSPHHVRKFLRSLSPESVLINGYGPTEGTTFTCCHLMDASSIIDGSVPIGKPINDTTVYILDGQNHPTSTGISGELCIGGAGLARGYLNRPELTAEKFIPDPFSAVPGARLYRSGDRARHGPDGNIEFLGRIDHQVKIRGFRVEPGEIEAALVVHPGVREAVVIARSGVDGEKCLVVYVVPEPGGSATSLLFDELRAFLKGTLPDYMLPSACVVLSALPLTLNGKVDRKALPPPESLDAGSALEGDPRNLLEQQLLRIWQRALGRSDFGIHANFFAMGGHSLIAARLAGEIEQLLGHKVPIASFFQAQSVATLAALLSNHQDSPAWSSLVPLQPEGDNAPLFVIHGWGGHLYAYVHLARAFAPDRPVYGLQAVGLTDKTSRHGTIEEMADYYCAQIRSVRPFGPYHLVGYSLGGWIAYAVAQRLLRQGGSVGLLALLDTHATANVHQWLNYDEWLQMARYLAERIPVHAGKLFRRPEGGRIAHLKKCLRSQRQYLRTILKKSEPTPPPSAAGTAASHPSGTLSPPGKPDHFFAVHRQYRPPRLNLEVQLLTTEKTKKRTFLFWRYYARRGVTIHRLFQEHDDFYQSRNAEPLASLLRQLLHEIENPGISSPR